MLEGIMVVGAEPAPAITRATTAHRSRAAPGSDLSRSSRRRTRRRHHGPLVAVELSDEGATVTAVGRALFSAAAFPPNGGPWNHRLYCRPCLDWSERRPHLAGVLGKALLERALETKLVRRREGSRALDVAQGPDDMLQRLDLV